MGKLLPKSFYTRTDVVKISKELLGKVLCTKIDGKYCEGIIAETEAYRAPDDKACHAYNNKRTPRTEIMFNEGGCSYVYICYGIHHLFNVVTAEKNMAHAVLIRAIEPISGIKHMLKRRELDRISPRLTAGPGSLGKAMGIKVLHSGVNLMAKKQGIWIEDQGIKIRPSKIIAGPRVGMTSAEECKHWPWRFRIIDSKWTSKPNKVIYED